MVADAERRVRTGSTVSLASSGGSAFLTYAWRQVYGTALALSYAGVTINGLGQVTYE